jgi:tetratricopeptide (TPR) repeat protein
MILAWILTAFLKPAVPAASGPAPAPEAFEKEWPAIVADLERATLDSDMAGLRRAVEACRRWRAAAPPARRPLVTYALGYSAWRLAFLRAVPAKEREALLKEAADTLEEAVQADPRSAEAHALLASVYGAQIAVSPMRGIMLGSRIDSHLKKALDLEPNNPRVVLQDGISAFNTPPSFGGSAEKAEASFRRSLALFGQEPPDRPWPNWGRFDAHVWLGQALAKKGDRDGARREYEAALVLAPNSQWVRRGLLPRLAQPKAGGG